MSEFDIGLVRTLDLYYSDYKIRRRLRERCTGTTSDLGECRNCTGTSLKMSDAIVAERVILARAISDP